MTEHYDRDMTELFRLNGRLLTGTIGPGFKPDEGATNLTAFDLNDRPMLFERYATRAAADRRAEALMQRADVSRVKGEPR